MNSPKRSPKPEAKKAVKVKDLKPTKSVKGGSGWNRVKNIQS